MEPSPHNTIDLNKLKGPKKVIELGETLGRGSYGEVKKGRIIRTNKDVAVKIMRVNTNNTDALKKELRFLKNSAHCNIVGYEGAYLHQAEEHYELWIVMELCGFGSIKSMKAPLPENWIAYICKGIIAGLCYLHGKNIIHRDIKPTNILLTDDCVVKLADFGVSAKIANFDKRRTYIGSPYYMAPEVKACQTDRMAAYDSKADLWSLGITAMELAEEPNLVQFLRHREGNKGRWSQNFKDFVAECLDEDPKARKSAEQLLEHPFLQNLPELEIKNEIKEHLSAQESLKRFGRLIALFSRDE